LASSKTKHEIYRVKAKNFDHNFTVIGNPEELPPEKIVVVDAWPVFLRAHTLDVGVFEVGFIRAKASAEADSMYELDDAKLLANAEIKFPAMPPAERLFEIGNVVTTYEQMFSINDKYVGLDYRLNMIKGRFDMLPHSYVVDRIGHISNYIDATRPRV
jgi:hypothetical protein